MLYVIGKLLYIIEKMLYLKEKLLYIKIEVHNGKKKKKIVCTYWEKVVHDIKKIVFVVNVCQVCSMGKFCSLILCGMSVRKRMKMCVVVWV